METFKKEKTYLVFLIISTVLALGLNIFIIVHACLNGDQSTTAANPIVEISIVIVNTFVPNAVNDGNILNFTILVRKLIGHFSLYCVSALLTCWSLYMWIKPLNWFKPYKYLIISVSFGVFMSALTEIIQAFIPGRSGQVTDALIDFAGYYLGLLIILLILFIRYMQNLTKRENDVTSN